MKFEDLGLDVREEEVWITVLGEELGGLEGNESGFVTSSSKGSGYGETEKREGGHLIKMNHVLCV